jgi:hypothetical protein
LQANLAISGDLQLAHRLGKVVALLQSSTLIPFRSPSDSLSFTARAHIAHRCLPVRNSTRTTIELDLSAFHMLEVKDNHRALID